MTSKYYQCDEELKKLILSQGWIETTGAKDKLKGKKEFRRSPKARAFILFDYINFVVVENRSGCNGIGGSRLAVEDLRLLFWYLNSNAADKQFISNGHFDLNYARRTHLSIIKHLGYAKELNCITRRSKKSARLLNNYFAIDLT